MGSETNENDFMTYDEFRAKADAIMAVPATGRVANGVAVLDATKPDWWELIDLNVLDMGDADLCVLGQLHGDYWRGVRELSDEVDNNRSNLFAYHHGYDSRNGWDSDKLTAEWERVIRERREAAARTVNELTEARLKGDAAAELAALLHGMDLEDVLGREGLAALTQCRDDYGFESGVHFTAGAGVLLNGVIRVLEVAAAGGRNGTWLR